jgi:hypothetical protein
MKVPGSLPCVLAIGFLIWGLLFSSSASAVTLPTATYLISFKRNGTPSCAFADFSMVCYGHSFLNVAMDNQHVNTTAENPVPLSRVLDLQVSCNPLSCCRASSYDAGDSVRTEWCVLNGTTTGGEVVSDTIMQEDLSVNCSGREYETQYLRCSAEAGAKHPCTGLPGSSKFRCNDALHEDTLDCLAAYDESINQSSDLKRYSGISKVCEIRFNRTSAEILQNGRKGMVPDSVQSPTGATTARSPVESFSCSILQLFGGRCP